MNARYYDPVIGQFASPDTVVPDPTVVMDYNRYLYARANPLKYNDPTGHSGQVPCMCGGYVGADAVVRREGNRMALQFLQAALDAVGTIDPTPVADGINAGIYLVQGKWSEAGVSGLAIVPAVGELAKLAKQWDTVGQASKIWDQLPLRRGMLAEQELGRSARLVQNFPVIDKFENGVATSIKTLDWRASTYQDPARLESKVRGYIDKLANWQGASWGKETIQAADIRQRELLLGLPPGFSEEQGAIFDRLIEYGRNNGVDVRIAIITE